nr:major facilitator transporter [uncultured bacterium]
MLWTGQTVSAIGSSLTAFSLGVWVYQKSGSVTQFALIFLLAALPKILLAPVAGALVDRWNRRTAMFLGDTGAALSTLAVALLLWADRLAVWHIYAATAAGAIFGTLQMLAYSAATTQLVEKKDLGRANGMVQTSFALSHLAAPAIAGFLLAAIGLRGVILVDFATFLAALAMLLIVRIPDLRGEARARKHVLRDAFYGLEYLKVRPGLIALLALFAIMNLSLGFLQSLVTPLVLTFASPRELGVIASVSGSGMLVGGLLMTAWGGPKRRLVQGVLAFTLLQGCVLFLAGLRPNGVLVAIGGFLFMFFNPLISGCCLTLWQRKVEPEAQGRVFAMRQMIAWSTLPLAYLLAGPLADGVFEPLLAAGGPLAGSVGRILGVGPGRGTGLLIVVLGLLNVLSALAGSFYPRLRNLDAEVPDAAAPVRPPRVAEIEAEPA